MALRFVVAQPLHASVEAYLRGHGDIDMNPGPEPWTADELARRCAAADALIVFMTERVDASLVAAAPRLSVVAGALKGYDNVDVEALNARGIPLTIVPDLLTAPTAELALGLMIALARNVLAGDRGIRTRGFAGWRPTLYGASIEGATVGVVGAGAVGRAILRLLSGFSCRRLYCEARPVDPGGEAGIGAERTDLATLRAEADFLVLATPLTADTLGMVDDAFLAAMKPGAFLVNPARGSLVDEAAVARALAAGRLGGYAADAFALEDHSRPDRPDRIPDALLSSDRTVLTPHIGSAVGPVREAIERSAAESAVAVLSGDLPETCVNAEAVRAARAERVVR